MTEQAAPTQGRVPPMLAPWIHWRRKRFWLLVAFFVYTLLGFFAAPPLVRWLIVSTMEEAGRSATVETVKVNPFTLTLLTRNLEVRDTDEVPIFRFDELFVNFQSSSLFRWAWTFKEIRLAGLYLHEERFSGLDTRYTRLIEALGDTAEEAPAEPEPGALPRLVIQHFLLQDGRFALKDRVADDFESEIGPVNVEVHDISTLPDRSGEHTVSIRTAEGGHIEWRGSLQAVPFASQGHLVLSGKGLAVAFRYADPFLPFQVFGDSETIELDYHTGLRGDTLFLSVENLQVHSLGAGIRPDDGGEDFLRIDTMDIAGGSFQWPEQVARIEKIRIDQPVMRAGLLPDGSLDLLALVPEFPQGDDSPADATPWTVEIGALDIQSAAVKLTDATLSPPAEVSLDALQLNLSGIDNRDGTAMPVELHTQISTGGGVRYSGSLQVLPDLRSNGRLTLDEVNIALLQPYVEPYARIGLQDGSLTVNADFEHGPQQPARLEGDLTVDKLQIHDRRLDERLLAWDSLQLDRFEADLAANSLVTSRLQFDGLFGRFHIAEDLTTNVSDLLVEQADPEEATERAGETPMPDLQIGGVRFDNAALDFSDFSLPLPFRAEIRAMGGEISTLATASSEPASVAMEGQVNEFGQARIDGELDPWAPTDLAQIDMAFRNLDLSRLTPYTVQFAGYAIDEGRMDLDLAYRLDQRRMNGDNNIVIRDIVLGEKIEHPDAGSLPMGLAIALLTDANGVIDLDLQVEGDLDNPEFGIGSVIWQALGNLITKAVTAPFRLLGKLVGIDSEDFGTLRFAAGRSDISPPDREQLLKLGEAMLQRPELTVEVGGVYDVAADTAALKAMAVAEMAAQRAQELPIGEDELSTDHDRRVLESLAAEQLPALDLAALQAGHMRTPEDAEEAVLDLPAYVTDLRRQLEAAQAIGEAELVELAGARAAAALATLRESQPGADLRAVLAEPRAVEAENAREIPLELEVSVGD